MISLAFSDVATGIDRRLGELDDLRPGARGDDAAARDDDRPRASRQRVGRSVDRRRLGLGTERGVLLEALFGEQLEIALAVEHLAGVAAQLEVHRARRAAGRGAKRLPQQVGQALDACRP